MFLNQSQIKRIKIVLLGGDGSGNFDHAGRPGKVGGSAEKGAGKNIHVLKWRDQDGQEHKGIVKKIDKYEETPKNGMGVYAIKGKNKGEILYTSEGEDVKGSATHGQMVRAVHPEENVDNYVRFYFDKDFIQFNTLYASEEIGKDDEWKTRAVNNIYKTMDKLSSAGIPDKTKVFVLGPGGQIVTTIK